MSTEQGDESTHILCRGTRSHEDATNLNRSTCHPGPRSPPDVAPLYHRPSLHVWGCPGGQTRQEDCGLPLAATVPLAAVLFGDNTEGHLCVRKTPAAMGWEAQPAWALVKAPATVYAWSIRLLLCN